MKTLLTLSRYIVGLLFIFSGLVKANDPLGLSYKMQEFFEVWGLHGLNDFTLILSILMIAFEIIAGVAVIIGWQMKLFSWLLLILIIFFTFLTGYALFSGKIKTCGCFGDCIPLTAAQSFVKDLILLAFILLLFRYRNSIVTTMSSRSSIFYLLLATIFSVGLQWYVLEHLPIVDCLPYKKGKVINEQMKIPPGAIPDSTVISFVYSRGGKEMEFTSDQFPEDFSEEQYTFIRRYDKLIRKGNAEPAIRDFVLLADSGTDTTQAILAEKGISQWLFIKEMDDKNLNTVKELLPALIKKSADSRQPLYIITPIAGIVQEKIGPLPGTVTVLRCDVVAVKTAARHDITLYQIKDGTILNKWALPDISKALK